MLLISQFIKKVLSSNQSFIQKLSYIQIPHVLLSEKLLLKSSGADQSLVPFFTIPQRSIHYVIGSVFNFLSCPSLFNHNLGDLRTVMRTADETRQNTFHCGFGRSKNSTDSIVMVEQMRNRIQKFSRNAKMSIIQQIRGDLKLL